MLLYGPCHSIGKKISKNIFPPVRSLLYLCQYCQTSISADFQTEDKKRRSQCFDEEKYIKLIYTFETPIFQLFSFFSNLSKNNFSFSQIWIFKFQVQQLVSNNTVSSYQHSRLQLLCISSLLDFVHAGFRRAIRSIPFSPRNVTCVGGQGTFPFRTASTIQNEYGAQLG